MDIATPVSDAVTPVSAKEDWVRRFAYRAMLCEPALDTDSAFMVAGAQFDDAADLAPEVAADIYAASRPGANDVAREPFS